MKIEVAGDVAQLTTGDGKKVSLSVQDLSSLALNAHRILDQLASRQTGQGKVPVVASRPVRDLAVRLDMHHSQALIQFEFEDDTKFAYALNAGALSKLRDALTEKIDQIEAAKADQAKH